MNDKKLPIRIFAIREDVDELRTEGGGGNEPKWVLSGKELYERSQKLSSDIAPLKTEFCQRKDSVIPFVIKAKVCSDATSKSKRSCISHLFDVSDKNKIIGVVSTDELLVEIDSIQEITAIERNINDLTNHGKGISCLDNLSGYEPLVFKDEICESYKVKLLDFHNYSKNRTIQRFFETTIDKINLPWKKTFYTPDLPVYKLENIGKGLLDKLTDSEIFEAIYSIEPMPKYGIELDLLKDEREILVQHPINNKEYVTLGILDNGISCIPHFEPWLTGHWSCYPEEYISASHGTIVAGVALYGDKCEAKEMVGSDGVKLFDATVFPDSSKENIDEDQLINNIKEVVHLKHDEIKIWNLSISIVAPVQDDCFSDFAIALDSIQDEYNVLICKSAGNCNNFARFLPKGRIHAGADSVRSLVVGSVAHERNQYDLVDIGEPSPFSRIGPGPSFIIKPEVSHYGGNAGIAPTNQAILNGVTSFSQDGSLVKSAGTSFSTPRISAIAAGIYQELNEDFDPLFIKALIVHNASYPEKLKIPEEERTIQMGFGIPGSINNILYNSPNEVTLVLRDTLVRRQFIDIMDFPMPDCLIGDDGLYFGQVIATLVYNPILDRSQGAEYCQSNLDLKFGSYDFKKERDTTKNNILNPIGRAGAKNLLLKSVFSKKKMSNNPGDFALRERLLIQYADKYYPVKKYAIDLEEMTEANRDKLLSKGRNWFLRLDGLYRDNTERNADLTGQSLKQDFCLIITIRDPKGLGDVYTGISQKLDEYNFWHRNINIHSDLRVTI